MVRGLPRPIQELTHRVRDGPEEPIIGQTISHKKILEKLHTGIYFSRQQAGEFVETSGEKFRMV